MNLKTCHKCGEQQHADADHFQTKRKSRADGTAYPVITSPCRACYLAQRREFRHRNLEPERERVRLAMAARRASGARRDRDQENAARREQRALAAGFASHADRLEHDRKKRLFRALVGILKAVRRQRDDRPEVCWLWNRPGITPGEKWRLRYRLDAEFRAREIDRLYRRQEKLARVTPRWVDRRQLAAIYAGCPEGCEVDHIVPIVGITPDGLRVSGLHVPWNLRYLWRDTNQTRRNQITADEMLLIESSRLANGLQPYGAVCNPLQSAA